MFVVLNSNWMTKKKTTLFESYLGTLSVVGKVISR